MFLTIQGAATVGQSSRNLFKKRKAAGKLRDAKDFADKIHVNSYNYVPYNSYNYVPIIMFLF